MDRELSDNDPRHFEASSGEDEDVLGLSVERVGSRDFDIYAIGIPPDSFYQAARQDAIVDMFTFNILGPSDVVAGRVILYDVEQRLQLMPPNLRAMWQPMVDARYALVLQMAPAGDMYELGSYDDLTHARRQLIEWMERIRPGEPIQVRIGRDLRTLWASDLPGLRTVQVQRPTTPYSHLVNPN